jgi:hypothetical protein
MREALGSIPAPKKKRKKQTSPPKKKTKKLTLHLFGLLRCRLKLS